MLPYFEYQLNQKGLVLGIYDEIRKPKNMLAEIKSANALLFVLAGIHKNKYHFDDCLLLNEQGNIIEATSSNVFLVKGNQLFTPPLEDACLPGIMRSLLLSIAEEAEIEVKQLSISIADLEVADEVFLTNAVSGIRWVLGYGPKRYFNQKAKFLIQKINNKAFSS